MDVNTVLLSVEERDKWRHRLVLLERSLADVQEQRSQLALRLRRLKRELSRLSEFSDAIIDPSRRPVSGGPIHAANTGRIPTR